MLKLFIIVIRKSVNNIKYSEIYIDRHLSEFIQSLQKM